MESFDDASMPRTLINEQKDNNENKIQVTVDSTAVATSGITGTQDDTTQLLQVEHLINNTIIPSAPSRSSVNNKVLQLEEKMNSSGTIQSSSEVGISSSQSLSSVTALSSVITSSSVMTSSSSVMTSPSVTSSVMTSAAAELSTISSGLILQSCNFSRLPVISSVFSLQGTKSTSLVAADTNTQIIESTKSKKPEKESISCVKKLLHVNTSLKRQMPVFVSALNLWERQKSSLHECTLLKVVDRYGGFFKWKMFTTMGLKEIFIDLRGPRQRLTFQELTKKCYEVFEIKMKNFDKSKTKLFLEVLGSFLSLFDWYCNKNSPIITVAMYIYLPNPIDYSFYTWHGVYPTGWSEYCRLVVIREVIQFILDNAKVSSTLPPYSAEYFSSPSNYSSNLLPRLLPAIQNLTEDTPCGNITSNNKQMSKISQRSCAGEGANIITKETTSQTHTREDTYQLENVLPTDPLTNWDPGLTNCRITSCMKEVLSNQSNGSDRLLTDTNPSRINDEASDVNDVSVSMATTKKRDDSNSVNGELGLDKVGNRASGNNIVGEIMEGPTQNNRSSKSSPITSTDANPSKIHNEEPVVDNVSDSMATTKKQDNSSAENGNKTRNKPRKRNYFACFIDERIEGENEPNKHIKLRIKRAPPEETANTEKDNTEAMHLSTGHQINDSKSQPFSMDIGQADNVEVKQNLNDDTTNELNGMEIQQKDGESSDKLKDLGVNELGRTEPIEEDIRRDGISESTVVMLASCKVQNSAETQGHVDKTKNGTSEGTLDEIPNTDVSRRAANETATHQEGSSVGIGQASSLNDHCKINLFENEGSSDNMWSPFDEVTNKRSRLFDALWSNRTPFEPHIHMPSGSRMALSEYLVEYPIVTTSVPPGTRIEIDSKMYDASEVLGHFSTGVCFLCHKVGQLSIAKTVHSLDSITDDFCIDEVKAVKLGTLRAAISKNARHQKSLSPDQKLHNEMIGMESCDKMSSHKDGIHGDEKLCTKVRPIPFHGNAQPSESNSSDTSKLVEEIDHLRKTANFLNELASSLEARLSS